MQMLVYNCFHWLGYHLTDELLKQGYHVDGIQPNMSQQEQFLAMFLGRNDRFTQVDKGERNYSFIFSIDKLKEDASVIPEGRLIMLSSIKEAETISRKSVLSLSLPLLFGEWMPMDAEGIFYHEQYISFSSDRFNKEAVDVRLFINKILKTLHRYKYQDWQELQDLLLDSLDDIRNNEPIAEKVKSLQKHYEKFQLFYQ